MAAWDGDLTLTWLWLSVCIVVKTPTTTLSSNLHLYLWRKEHNDQVDQGSEIVSATEENTFVYDADSKFSARWITAVEFQGMCMNQLFVAKPLQSGPVVVRSCRVYLLSFRHDRRARLRGSKDPGQRTASRRRLYCYLRLPLLRVSSSAIENRNWAYAIEEERATGWGSDPWRNQQQSCHDLLRSADNGKKSW